MKPHSITINIEVRAIGPESGNGLAAAQDRLNAILKAMPPGCHVRDYSIKAPPRPR